MFIHDGLIVVTDDVESIVSDGSPFSEFDGGDSSAVPDGNFLFRFHFIRRFWNLKNISFDNDDAFDIVLFLFYQILICVSLNMSDVATSKR